MLARSLQLWASRSHCPTAVLQRMSAQWAQHLSSAAPASSTTTPADCPIETPAHLVQASLADIEALLPFSWQIAIHRHRSIESRGMEVYYKARSSPVQPLLSVDYPTDQPRSPSDSYIQLVYPFSVSPALQDQYRRFSSDHMRWGLLLEDMDTLAGDIAGCHAGLKGGRVPATAFVDRFTCMSDGMSGRELISLANDLRLDGQVTWVGRSSLEVLITLSARIPTTATHTQSDTTQTDKSDSEIVTNKRPASPSSNGSGWRYAGYARFVMVMRDATATQSVQVPPLQPHTPSERALFEEGEEHNALRKQKRATHWRNMPPTDAEVRLIHKLAVSRISAPAATATAATATATAASNTVTAAAPAGVPIHVTEMRTAALMHSQDRNHFNRIFGGHLMRLAFEHAFTVAAMHAQAWCDPVCMEDVVFIQPVPIGTVMQLRGKVVYTEGAYLRVLVEAVTMQPGEADKAVMTNDFSFSFRCTSGPVKPVYPDTVVEALEYVLGQRQHQEDEDTNNNTQ